MEPTQYYADKTLNNNNSENVFDDMLEHKFVNPVPEYGSSYEPSWLSSIIKGWLFLSICGMIISTIIGSIEIHNSKNLHYVKGTIITPCVDPNNSKNAVKCNASISYSIGSKSYNVQSDLDVGEYKANDSIYVVYSDNEAKPLYVTSSNVIQPRLGIAILVFGILQAVFSGIACYMTSKLDFSPGWIVLLLFFSACFMTGLIVCIGTWVSHKH